MGFLKKVFRIEPKKQASFIEITDDNFQKEVWDEGKPVMLFVWSNSCPHCKKMAPNVMSIGGRFEETIKSAHTNSSLAPNALGALEVRGVPSLLFIKDKNIVERIVGFRPVAFLEELVEAHFNAEHDS